METLKGSIMLQHLPLLSLLIWTPVFGAIPVVFIGVRGFERQAKALALFIGIICLLLCLALFLFAYYYYYVCKLAE